MKKSPKTFLYFFVAAVCLILTFVGINDANRLKGEIEGKDWVRLAFVVRDYNDTGTDQEYEYNTCINVDEDYKPRTIIVPKDTYLLKTTYNNEVVYTSYDSKRTLEVGTAVDLFLETSELKAYESNTRNEYQFSNIYIGLCCCFTVLFITVGTVSLVQDTVKRSKAGRKKLDSIIFDNDTEE